MLARVDFSGPPIRYKKTEKGGKRTWLELDNEPVTSTKTTLDGYLQNKVVPTINASTIVLEERQGWRPIWLPILCLSRSMNRMTWMLNVWEFDQTCSGIDRTRLLRHWLLSGSFSYTLQTVLRSRSGFGKCYWGELYKTLWLQVPSTNYPEEEALSQ